MSKFYEITVPKVQRTLGLVLSILFSIQIFIAGILKVVRADVMIEQVKLIPHMADLMVFVGLLELILLGLYWYPQTRKIGFYLMCSFMGGVIVAEITAGKVPTVGIITAVLLYAGTLLRYPRQMLKS